jgi:hypothetical protein
VPFHGSGSLQNGNILARITGGVISFFRTSTAENGSQVLDLLTAEYTDDKTITARFYRQDFRANSFAAEFSFSADPTEQFYGAGQQPCCNDNTVNKKGQVVDLLNFNSQVTMPIYMSNKGYLQFFNMPSQGRIGMYPMNLYMFAKLMIVARVHSIQNSLCRRSGHGCGLLYVCPPQ